jgi:hypothetical protein
MHSAEAIGPDYVTAQQLAQELKVTHWTLQRWRRTRRGPPTTIIGRHVYYRRQAIKEWLLAREGSTRSDLRPLIEARPLQRNARRYNARRAVMR